MSEGRGVEVEGERRGGVGEGEGERGRGPGQLYLVLSPDDLVGEDVILRFRAE